MQSWCDARAIRRVVENLLGNAVKYGWPAETIRIRLEQEGGSIILTVHNHGDPIPPHEQLLLFEPYRRSLAASRSPHHGWGIGLGLVRGLIEAHGGKVSVSSSAEVGTTFLARFPRDSRTNKQIVARA